MPMKKYVLHKYLLITVDFEVVGFHYDVISCELERQDVRRAAWRIGGQRERRSPARVGVIMRSV